MTSSFELQCEALDCKVQLQGLNPFGEVNTGTLTLRGRLKHILVREWQKDCEEGAFLSRGTPSIFDDQTSNEIGWVQPDDCRWTGREFWYIPLVGKPKRRVMQCLALIPTDSEDPMDHRVKAKEFTRVGMLWMWPEDNDSGPEIPPFSPVHWLADAAISTITVV